MLMEGQRPKTKDLKFPLNISREGQLAAFLAFWLSRFVLPLDNAIRPECFYMASLMARGFRVSLAPAVLGLIYHALGTVATHRRGPDLANAYLPIHYVIGWLGEHFPDLIDRRSDNDFPAHYPLLARYSQIEAKYVSSNQARMIFRSEFMVYRPSVFLAQEDCILLDTESLADDAFEFLVCMRSALLPVRWWMTACAPYVGFSVSKIFSVVDRHVPRRDHVFVTNNLKSISTGMSKSGFNSSSLLHGASSSRGHKKRIHNAKGEHFSGVNHVMHQSQRINRDSHHKRARHADHKKVEDGSSSHVLDEESSNPVQGEMRFNDILFPREMEPINVDNPAFEVISSGEEENIHYKSANSIMGGSGSDFLAEVSEFQQVQNSPADDQFPESVGPIAVVRPLQNLVSVANFVHQIFGNGVNQNRREFISREIEGDIPRAVPIEALGDVNIDVIHDLIRQHEECLNTKLALEAELTKVAKEIEDLDVKEVTIREAEERVRQMREEHEAKKTSLNMQKMNFEISLEHQNEQAIQLQQSRIDAKEDLLPQIGSTPLSMKAQEREIHRLINALFSSCSEL
ncbi:hypothetical protein L3X38_012394 [Prunus dulcis]|uniref:Aminotransferase-like plant mobile domain-containing protein n=1 Tax=Prunus dulcis TaxID=3755 RepID=A0AAD4WLH6_PRUDU|nr:hypothetical protein L3X38_012394 [Prunus dulcis]